MLDVLRNIGQALLGGLGIDVNFFDLDINILYFLYAVGAVMCVAVFYMVAFRRVEHYARLMDRYLMELWTKEEADLKEEGISDEVRKVRIQRLKETYNQKIDTARRRRDRIFRFVPLLKRMYKWRKGDNAPMYTLP